MQKLSAMTRPLAGVRDAALSVLYPTECRVCGSRIESWRDGELVGGLYGIALGRVFFGESMFAYETDASKVALTGLVQVLRELEMPLIDCQQETAHLASLGARPIPRDEFAAALSRLVHLDHAMPLSEHWIFDT